MVTVYEVTKCACDPKVPNTGFAVPSDQDIVLDGQASTCEITRFFGCLPEQCHRAKYLIHEDR